jgi:hypothetical protein
MMKVKPKIYLFARLSLGEVCISPVVICYNSVRHTRLACAVIFDYNRNVEGECHDW